MRDFFARMPLLWAFQCRTMASWSESVKSYVVEKSHNAPELVPMRRWVRGDGAARRGEVREYNILTGTHKEGASAALTAQRTSADVQASSDHVTKAMNKGLAQSYHCYDVVTMAPKYGVAEATVLAVGGNMEPRGKRIEVQDAHIGYHPIHNGLIDGLEHLPDPRVVKPPRRDKVMRQTNILNHTYVDNHDAKTAADEQAIQRAVEQATTCGRDFNPITQTFTDAQAEANAVRDKGNADSQQRHVVKTHTYGTSGIVKRSEGHAFDIVTNHVYNPDMVLTLDKKNCAGMLQRVALRQKWEYQRDVEEAVRDTDVQRSMNRISAVRVQQLAGDNGGKPRATSTLVSSKPTAMSTLTSSLKTKPTHHNEVLRESGPRTTYERMFNASAGEKSNHVSTFAGRQQLLLPTIEKVKARAPNTGNFTE
jgi:hypothetical protein